MNSKKRPKLSQIKRIGHYKVLNHIGSGGAGEVFACQDETLNRKVAVKWLFPSATTDSVQKERFTREGQMMARISSPYVVQVFGFGEEQERPYLVMEYVDGEDLERLLLRKKQPFEAAEALGYIHDVAQGLMAALDLGVIHRDIKPANIIVSRGKAQIMDFGLARPEEGNTQLTTEGVVVGTPAFLAPERAQALGDDMRSDIYSLGVTLFTLLHGKPPFVYNNAMDVIRAHIREEVPSLSELHPSLPIEIGLLVIRMMAKQPSKRFETYEELLEVIENIVMQLNGETRKSTTSHSEDQLQALEAELAKERGLQRQSTGVMGSLKRMSLIELVQMLQLGKKSAVVDILPYDSKPAMLWIQKGEVQYCKLDTLRGEKAFYQLNNFKEGGFQIHYDRDFSKRNIDASTAYLLLECLRRTDEEQKLRKKEEISEALELAQVRQHLSSEHFVEQVDEELEQVFSPFDMALPVETDVHHQTMSSDGLSEFTQQEEASIEDVSTMIFEDKNYLRSKLSEEKHPFGKADEQTVFDRTPAKKKLIDELSFPSFEQEPVAFDLDASRPLNDALFEASARHRLSRKIELDTENKSSKSRNRSKRKSRNKYTSLTEKKRFLARVSASISKRKSRFSFFRATLLLLTLFLLILLWIRFTGTGQEFLAKLKQSENTYVQQFSQYQLLSAEINDEGINDWQIGMALWKEKKYKKAFIFFNKVVNQSRENQALLKLMLQALEHKEHRDSAKSLLIAMKTLDVGSKLIASIGHASFEARLQIYEILRKRKELSKLDQEMFWRENLQHAPKCAQRKSSYLKLKKLGKVSKESRKLLRVTPDLKENICFMGKAKKNK